MSPLPFSAERPPELRHHMLGEQRHAALRFRLGDVAEGELADEIIGARFGELLAQHADDALGRAGDAAAAILDLIEITRPILLRPAAMLGEEIVEVTMPFRIEAPRERERLLVG